MKVYILVTSGRTGNQIFQMLGTISFLEKKSLVLIWGSDPEIEDIFSLPSHCICIHTNTFLWKAWYLLRKIPCAITVYTLLSKTFFFRFCEDKKVGVVKCVTKPLIRFPVVNLIYRSYFQSERFFDSSKIPFNISLRHSFISFDYSKQLVELASSKCSIHVRRSDYSLWPSKESRAILPMSFYVDSFLRIHQLFNCRHFFIFSDDFDYASDLVFVLKKFVPESSSVYFSVPDLSPVATLSFLFNSDYLVLSSSFSWSAYVMSNFFDGKVRHALAPLYWSGHRMKKWYPPLSQSKTIDYLQVNSI